MAVRRERGARERQIQFPPNQTHHPLVAPVMLVTSLVCIVIVVAMLLLDVEGPFIGPWG